MISDRQDRIRSCWRSLFEELDGWCVDDGKEAIVTSDVRQSIKAPGIIDRKRP